MTDTEVSSKETQRLVNQDRLKRQALIIKQWTQFDVILQVTLNNTHNTQYDISAPCWKQWQIQRNFTNETSLMKTALLISEFAI